MSTSAAPYRLVQNHLYRFSPPVATQVGSSTRKLEFKRALFLRFDEHVGFVFSGHPLPGYTNKVEFTLPTLDGVRFKLVQGERYKKAKTILLLQCTLSVSERYEFSTPIAGTVTAEKQSVTYYFKQAMFCGLDLENHYIFIGNPIEEPSKCFRFSLHSLKGISLRKLGSQD